MEQEVDASEVEFFRTRGLRPQAPEGLNRALVAAIERMHHTLYGESSDELTAEESAVLRRAGADLEEHPELSDPLQEGMVDFAAILSTSLTTTQAAARLGVHATRIRQMIGDRTLYAIRVDGRWHIPAFQFLGDALIPNIGQVNARLDRGLDAVSVYQWYTTADAELETPRGRVLSPLAWLKAGYSAEPVAVLARDL